MVHFNKEIVEGFEFFNMGKKHFLAELWRLSKIETALRDQQMCGLNDHTQKDLLCITELSLTVAINKAETVNREIQNLQQMWILLKYQVSNTHFQGMGQ